MAEIELEAERNIIKEQIRNVHLKMQECIPKIEEEHKECV